MPRLCAILLLAVFSFPLFAPLLRAQTAAASKVPACCRRDGKHGCSMNSGAIAKTGLRAHCPMYPAAQSMPAGPAAAFAHPIQLLRSPVLQAPEAVEQAEARYRVSYSRTSQKRGPPSLHS